MLIELKVNLLKGKVQYHLVKVEMWLGLEILLIALIKKENFLLQIVTRQNYKLSVKKEEE
jgi:hypothetical protein